MAFLKILLLSAVLIVSSYATAWQEIISYNKMRLEVNRQTISLYDSKHNLLRSSRFTLANLQSFFQQMGINAAESRALVRNFLPLENISPNLLNIINSNGKL
jgi:hypothetical protein